LPGWWQVVKEVVQLCWLAQCRSGSSAYSVVGWSHLFWLKFRDSQHQRRVWSDGSNDWIGLSVSSCTTIDQSLVVATVISLAYVVISSAYR